ncbi:hypothetical protein D9758_000432 [Tetrapyrgos nigripes]|uniref:Uncharacterized protein n=1 Tax=Tetrapyrgos nigripes TaxID=182062 RepID=A0A8H5H1F4_9AGAR|nr:hypothetical protein D9758_000432 [Tetrapyrgos nigripes]
MSFQDGDTDTDGEDDQREQDIAARFGYIIFQNLFKMELPDGLRYGDFKEFTLGVLDCVWSADKVELQSITEEGAKGTKGDEAEKEERVERVATEEELMPLRALGLSEQPASAEVCENIMEKFKYHIEPDESHETRNQRTVPKERKEPGDNARTPFHVHWVVLISEIMTRKFEDSTTDDFRKKWVDGMAEASNAWQKIKLSYVDRKLLTEALSIAYYDRNTEQQTAVGYFAGGKNRTPSIQILFEQGITMEWVPYAQKLVFN